jgi:hypothetical protein
MPAQIVWKRDPEFSSATKAEHAFVEGYELVAFDIPPDNPGAERVIGWEVWLPKKPRLGSAEEYAKRLQELMDDNDAFDELIEMLDANRSIKREEMRQIASGILGYAVPKRRGRTVNLVAIRNRQSSNVRRWVEPMQKPVGTGPRGLKDGSSASFEGATRLRPHLGPAPIIPPIRDGAPRAVSDARQSAFAGLFCMMR